MNEKIFLYQIQDFIKLHSLEGKKKVKFEKKIFFSEGPQV